MFSHYSNFDIYANMGHVCMCDILPAKWETVTWGKIRKTPDNAAKVHFDCVVAAVDDLQRKGDVSRLHALGLGYKSSLGKKHLGISLSPPFALLLFL